MVCRKAVALKLTSVLIFLLVSLLGLSTPQPIPIRASQAAFAWHVETVDSTGDVGLHTSLVLDGNGYPHISYRDWSSYDLKYAYQDASGWHVETVDSEGDVGLFTSLALDGNGYPHISYYDLSNRDLKYAYQDASGWYTETVDSSSVGQDWIGYYTSLALDVGGYPHISYQTYTPASHLRYAYQDASSWHIEIVDFTGGYYTSLALDEGGYPHISHWFEYGFVHELRYACLDASGWHTETVDTVSTDLAYAGGYTSLALDENGYPHISYNDGTAGNLKYAHYDGTTWQVEIVDRVGSWFWGGGNSLVLDENEHPHISYYDAGSLKYAYRDASGWHIETVDSERDVGWYTSLALDGEGIPHISYYDASNRDLKYAYAVAPPTPTPTNTLTPTATPTSTPTATATPASKLYLPLVLRNY
jgi:hypothetical protein